MKARLVFLQALKLPRLWSRGSRLLLAPFRAVAPLRASPIRVWIECVLLSFLLLLCYGTATAPVGNTAALLLLASLVSSWAAWRAVRLRGGFWAHLFKGLPYLALYGIVIGLTFALPMVLIQHLTQAHLVSTTQSTRQTFVSYATIVTAIYAFTRLGFLAVCTLVSRARQRLRWQLAVSHLAVILLTFGAVTSLGGLITVAFMSQLMSPNVKNMATSFAHIIQLTAEARPLNAATVQPILQTIGRGTIVLDGSSVTSLNGHNQPQLPACIFILRPDGSTLTAQAWGDSAVVPQPLALPSAIWQHLKPVVSSGTVVAYTADISPTVSKNGWDLNASLPTLDYGAAPIRDAQGVVQAVAVVEAVDTSNDLTRAALPVISIFTSVGMLAISLPVLLLAIVLGYLLSRGMTRRLEAVSRVTRAIAAGDLSQRVPVTTENEVGRLAADINAMTANLELMMSQLQQAHHDAEEALRARRELVASVSHELRTPLAIINAQLDTLNMRQTGELAPTGLHWSNGNVMVPDTMLNSLRSVTDRLAALVDDLFTLSRAETGGLAVECAPLDVGALLREVATLMRPLAHREGHITLTVEISPYLPLAYADGDRVRQVVENLIRNAVRHTPDGGIIALSASFDGQWLVLSVADTGEGIPASHLPHIFERFYRVDKSRGRDSGGAGLGLAIVREFVELMGGHVSVESVVGEGSCFRVSLPLASAQTLVSA